MGSPAAPDAADRALVENIERVQTRIGVARRLEPGPQRPSTERISDAELIGLLAEMGRPAGLIRIGEEVRLTTR